MARTHRLAAQTAPRAGRVVLDYAGSLTVSDVADNANPTLGLAHPLVVRLAAALGVTPAHILHLVPGEETVLCGRCSGTGRLPEFHYNGGDCYTCGGDPVVDSRTAYRVSYTADLAQATASRAYTDRLAATEGLDDFMAVFFDTDTVAPHVDTIEALIY